MLPTIVFFTALIGFFLMGTILIQNPKNGGVDSTFGGKVSNQFLGASKSKSVIEKITWGLAFGIFAFCILATLFI